MAISREKAHCHDIEVLSNLLPKAATDSGWDHLYPAFVAKLNEKLHKPLTVPTKARKATVSVPIEFTLPENGRLQIGDRSFLMTDRYDLRDLFTAKAAEGKPEEFLTWLASLNAEYCSRNYDGYSFYMGDNKWNIPNTKFGTVKPLVKPNKEHLEDIKMISDSLFAWAKKENHCGEFESFLDKFDPKLYCHIIRPEKKVTKAVYLKFDVPVTEGADEITRDNHYIKSALAAETMKGMTPEQMMEWLTTEGASVSPVVHAVEMRINARG